MPQHYFAYHFTISPSFPATDIVLASLQDSAFESFEETETGLIAYIADTEPFAGTDMDFDFLKSEFFSVSYRIEKISQVNWNEEWEKNFEPISVDGRCFVRAPFHESVAAEFDIVIEPKMSFGTGHHETTYLMISYLLDMQLADKTVLDMGCGTAILAILAAKKGAKVVHAIDNDHWCVENSLENIARNNEPQIAVSLGNAQNLENSSGRYDDIIANINRNILLQDLPIYVKSLMPNGEILLSGFFTHDISVIDEACKMLNLALMETKTRNNWVALKYRLNV